MASRETPAPERFLVVYRFMWDELGLDGITLRVFSRIYGFCRDGRSEFYESRASTAEFLGTTPRTVTRSINELLEKGLIVQTGLHQAPSGNATRSYGLTARAIRCTQPPDASPPPDVSSPPDEPSSQCKLNPDGSSGAPVTVRYPNETGKHRR